MFDRVENEQVVGNRRPMSQGQNSPSDSMGDFSIYHQTN
jgi:hypothetical protein